MAGGNVELRAINISAKESMSHLFLIVKSKK